jgi:hypothetical protein
MSEVRTLVNGALSDVLGLAKELAEKVPTFFVIPSEARNLSLFS